MLFVWTVWRCCRCVTEDCFPFERLHNGIPCVVKIIGALRISGLRIADFVPLHFKLDSLYGELRGQICPSLSKVVFLERRGFLEMRHLHIISFGGRWCVSRSLVSTTPPSFQR